MPHLSENEGIVAYPAAPWPLVGQLFLTVFRLPEPVGDRPAGIHGAAFVSYEEGSPLTYSELLVARPVGGSAVEIEQIWVDSPASMTADGSSGRSRRSCATSPWTAAAPARCPAPSGRPASSAAPSPTHGSPTYPGPAYASLSGAGPAAVAGARWPRGFGHHAGHLANPALSRPLGLRPRRPAGLAGSRAAVASVRMADFRMSFG